MTDKPDNTVIDPTEEQRLKSALGSLFGNIVEIAEDGMICIITGISGDALRATFAVRSALSNIAWHSARVDSKYRALALTGVDPSDPTSQERRLLVAGSMVCGFRGTSSIDTAAIISALMPEMGTPPEVLRIIDTPSPGAASWQTSSYEFAIGEII